MKNIVNLCFLIMAVILLLPRGIGAGFFMYALCIGACHVLFTACMAGSGGLSEDGTDDSIMECIPVYEDCAAQCDYHK